MECHSIKQLTTSLGDVQFKKTLFKNKKTGKNEYLLDRILGIKPGTRLTQDAVARLLKEAVQTSYRRGGEETSLTSEVSKQTVKNKLHQLTFSKNEEAVQKDMSVMCYPVVCMSSRPVGWSRQGAEKMAQLRAYYLNGGDMLELIRMQEKDLPLAVGAEYDILTANHR